MLKVKKFTVNPVQENCYVVSHETKEAVIIDCGCFDEFEWDDIENYIKNNGLKPMHLLNTHLHFDHSLGNHFAYKAFGLKPEASIKDSSTYENMRNQLRMFLGTDELYHEQPAIGRDLKQNDKVEFGKTVFDVIETPGHTPGGICFYCKEEGMLWAGDTLFRGSIGRTDLPGGNYRELVYGIAEKLLTLPEDTQVYCGHGPSTSIGFEKDNNPYL